MGIGRIYDNISQLSSSYQEALKALKMRKKIKDYQNCIAYSDIYIYDALYNLAEREEIKEWVKNKFSALKKCDKQNDTELLVTFRCLLEYDEDTASVAENLYIHKNIVLYRKRKIKEVMGIDPFGKPYKFKFKLASMLEKLI